MCGSEYTSTSANCTKTRSKASPPRDRGLRGPASVPTARDQRTCQLDGVACDGIEEVEARGVHGHASGLALYELLATVEPGSEQRLVAGTGGRQVRHQLRP